VHAPDVISSSDEPARAVRALPESSLVVATKLVAAGEADAVVSAGSTGAVLAAAALTYLPEQLRAFAQWRMIFYSLLLIGMMLLRPAGLLGSREIWWTWRRRLAPARTSGP